MQAALQLAALAVHFRLMGRIVARMGTGARPGVWSWVLGVRPLEIRPAGMLSLIAPLLRIRSLLQNRALSCGTGPLGYGWRV